MSEIDLAEFKNYSSNLVFKKTAEGYTIHISRSNYWVVGFSIAIAFFGIIPFSYAFQNPFLFIPSFLILWFAVYIYRLTLGYMEVRFSGTDVEFIWDDDIKNGERGEIINIQEIESVGLERMRRTEYSKQYYASRSRRSINYLEITFKDSSKKVFSCVDPAYTPLVSIFLKKYMKELEEKSLL
jgi:hypothetical protein